ncbi:MAG TPA: helix-turn-helix transcriptional regulator [Pyrinomonadaceae bacterium]|nr:helix-turn-helix transcriptional regulator [Pyrinomonadaceae bacterium]
MAPGQQLKRLRNKRHITVREVEQASRRIAEAKGDKRFRISNAWLAQLENGRSEPSSCKLFSLSVIYHVNLSDLLCLYDIDVANKDKYGSVANPDLTQLLSPAAIADLGLEAASSAVTSLVSESSTTHDAPFTFGEDNGQSHLTCGYLGSTDLTMYPLIRPGSLLKIDTSQNKLQTTPWRNEFERPIYFVELRDAYACGWCELQGNQLLIVPHHSSPATIRRFLYPREAEIVGRVVGYYTPCVETACAAVDKPSTSE